MINWGVGIPTPEVPVAKWALPWLKEVADPEELRVSECEWDGCAHLRVPVTTPAAAS